MKIEQELKQTKPFKSEFQKLMVNIQFTGSWLNAAVARALKPFDITPHQFNVLRILKGRYPEGYCNQEITARMIDKSSNATRIADKLVDKKLITRTEHASDRRLVDIRITKKGLGLLDQIDLSTSSVKNIGKKFNEEKARLMNEWLDELRGE